MVQVLKEAVRSRIEASALRSFADHGYRGTSIAGIAASAATAPGNVYRYFPSKQALFAAVVPSDLATRHDKLLDTRIAALTEGQEYEATATDRDLRVRAASTELLKFWLANRLAMSVLLHRAEGTPFAGYPAAFVQRMVDHAERTLPGVPSPTHRCLLDLVFDNTRQTIAHVLATAADDEQARTLITGFWRYQVPGLNGLVAFISTELDDRDAHAATHLSEQGGDGSSPPAARRRTAFRSPNR